MNFKVVFGVVSLFGISTALECYHCITDAENNEIEGGSCYNVNKAQTTVLVNCTRCSVVYPDPSAKIPGVTREFSIYHEDPEDATLLSDNDKLVDGVVHKFVKCSGDLCNASVVVKNLAPKNPTTTKTIITIKPVTFTNPSIPDATLVPIVNFDIGLEASSFAILSITIFACLAVNL